MRITSSESLAPTLSDKRIILNSYLAPECSRSSFTDMAIHLFSSKACQDHSGSRRMRAACGDQGPAWQDPHSPSLPKASTPHQEEEDWEHGVRNTEDVQQSSCHGPGSSWPEPGVPPTPGGHWGELATGCSPAGPGRSRLRGPH